MVIKSVTFAGAVARPGGPVPDRLPCIAFTGRSNVGKSSLINTVLGRTRNRVARVSVTPGRTQEINFFRVVARGRKQEHQFHLVDLPGYGYARVPAAMRERWAPLIEWFLARPEVCGVVQLIDSRHGPTKDDFANIERLARIGVPVIIALTKADKLRANERREAVGRWSPVLGVDPDQVVLFSSHTGEGREELLAGLDALLTEASAT
ncbi:MAG TPA: ribosome biogenesis GTP-binding protein YihA/YsxC [Longimicrobiales bacterium]|nr:ribosome biogenesis GTP-binding protein YihA/YsxC [Longimicrobiales bacterium]